MDFEQRVASIYSCLGHPHCRETVTIVTERNEPIDIDDLAREIATRSDPLDSDNHGSNPVESTSIGLYYSHLPKLADADLIEFDPDANLVSSTPVTTHLTALIQIGYSIAEEM